MSHSTCLVIGENPEEMLAPYDEGIEVDPYRSYWEDDKPQDSWAFGPLVENNNLDENADWKQFVIAYNESYFSEGFSLIYDEEKDRVYSMSTYNPKSKWDWYSLGGRWTGFFKLNSNARGVVGRPGLMTKSALPGYVDQVRKFDIDFDGVRVKAEAEAISFHAQCRVVLADHPILLTWQKIREMFPGDIEEARKYYRDQPAKKALVDAGIYIDDPAKYLFLGEDDPATAYINSKVSEVGIPYAILNADGWHECGRMGWFGISIDEDDEWPIKAQALIDAAPDDALFSLYDLHI